MNAETQPALLVDPAQRVFKVARRNFVDPEIFKAEKDLIFDKCWLYLGHSSELPNPGDFISRKVGGRSILFHAGQQGTASRAAQHMSASWRAGLPRAQG